MSLTYFFHVKDYFRGYTELTSTHCSIINKDKEGKRYILCKMLVIIETKPI